MNATLLEVVGWVGSAVLVVSLLQTNLHRLRWINLVGCLVLIGYNGLVGVWPMVGLNVVLAAINVWYLVRGHRDRHDGRAYEVLEVAADDSYLRHVLRVHAADIERWQPGFVHDPGADDDCYLVLTGDETVGVVVVRPGAKGRPGSSSTTSPRATATAPRVSSSSASTVPSVGAATGSCARRRACATPTTPAWGSPPRVTTTSSTSGGTRRLGPHMSTPGEAPQMSETPYRYTAEMAGRIETGWQDRWEELGTFRAPNPGGPWAEPERVREYDGHMLVLDMFPYPSGAGLHVGHPLGYIATDVYARYQRMLGKNVLHCLGYDAFGLPAEQFAVQTGQHPRVTTEANMATMKRQLRRLGLGHDDRRAFATIDPDYYRWTQWIFSQIFNAWYDEEAVRPDGGLGRARPIAELVASFESGERPLPKGETRTWSRLSAKERSDVLDEYRLVYTSHAPVNWAPGLGTVLANEEVTSDGRPSAATTRSSRPTCGSG